MEGQRSNQERKRKKHLPVKEEADRCLQKHSREDKGPEENRQERRKPDEEEKEILCLRCHL